MKKLLAVFVFVLWPVLVQAQITVDATSDGTLILFASTSTHAHTISGTNRVLYCGSFGGVDTNDLTATYNGTAMTEVGHALAAGDRTSYLWYQIAPTTGTHNVVVTSSLGGGGVFHVTCISFNGADQTTQPHVSTTDQYSNTGSPIFTRNVSVTTSTADTWLIAYSRGYDNVGSAFVGCTEDAVFNGSDGFVFCKSTSTVSSGSNTLHFTTSSGTGFTYWSTVMAAVNPVGGGGGGGGATRPCFGILLGVGKCHDANFSR